MNLRTSYPILFVLALGCSEKATAPEVVSLPPTPTLAPIETPKPVDAIIREVVTMPPQKGLTVPLVKGMIEQESTWNPKAKKFEPRRFLKLRKRGVRDAKNLATSHGLTQVLGETAARYGVHWKELEEPETAIGLGALVLRDCLRREDGNQRFALACYNAGFRAHRRYPAGALLHAERVLAKARKFGKV